MIFHFKYFNHFDYLVIISYSMQNLADDSAINLSDKDF